jgi:hypothetical protein
MPLLHIHGSAPWRARSWYRLCRRGRPSDRAKRSTRSRNPELVSTAELPLLSLPQSVSYRSSGRIAEPLAVPVLPPWPASRALGPIRPSTRILWLSPAQRRRVTRARFDRFHPPSFGPLRRDRWFGRAFLLHLFSSNGNDGSRPQCVLRRCHLSLPIAHNPIERLERHPGLALKSLDFVIKAAIRRTAPGKAPSARWVLQAVCYVCVTESLRTFEVGRRQIIANVPRPKHVDLTSPAYACLPVFTEESRASGRAAQLAIN